MKSVRFHRPACLAKRVAGKDSCVLEQRVPKGTDVMIVMRAINQSRELWGEGSTETRPERGFESSSGGAGSNLSFMTFLHGPTSCIGMGFAREEFASLLAVLVSCFEMQLKHADEQMKIEMRLTSRPKGGLKLRLRILPGW